jgi:uncharacterized protein (TIGR00297 family)
MGFAGRRRRALSRSGVAGAVIVGSSVFYAGGLRWAAVLLTFFGSSSALSRIKRELRGHALQPAVEARGSERDIVQALANGGVAAACAIWRGMRPGRTSEQAFAGSLAAANADTWATEIGKTSRKPPRMILSGAIATPGTSGAVSLRGLAASVCGSAAIAFSACAGSADRRRRQAFPAILLAGVVGALADSVAGATIQASYRCPVCDQPTERRTHSCGAHTILTSGQAWCNNDVVNAICTATGAISAAAICGIGERGNHARHRRGSAKRN